MRCGKTLSGYARALAVVFVSAAKTRSRHPSLLAWDNYSSQPFGASSILLLKAAGTLKYASKIAPCLVCASSRTVLFPDALATSGVGFVQPSSRSPRSPHLKSHSRQRRPTRLQVMTGNNALYWDVLRVTLRNYLAELFARYLAYRCHSNVRSLTRP